MRNLKDNTPISGEFCNTSDIAPTIMHANVEYGPVYNVNQYSNYINTKNITAQPELSFTNSNILKSKLNDLNNFFPFK